MPEISTTALVGWRVIATPQAIDAAEWPDASEVVRISPDDAFVIVRPGEPATPPVLALDPHAIVTPEHGFAGTEIAADDVAAIASVHIEWALPTQRPSVAQGQIAGVPAKLVLRADGSTLLLVACAARHELEDRLA